MLFDYMAPNYQPGRAGTVWSRFPLQPIAPGALTPFSYSVLAELASRAWYVYYDRLGFDPMPRPKVVRRHKGHAYFNLSLGAQLEADHAGVEPLALQINGQRQPLAAWEKPGFLVGFKLGRSQKKLDELPLEYARQMGTITEAAHAWYQKTQTIKRWGQAEILQVMEEIERVGVESMVALLAARLNLAHCYSRLVADLAGNVTTAQALLSINAALCDMGGLVEVEMLNALATTARAMAAPDARAWLKEGELGEWRTALRDDQARAAVKGFLDTYGHRALYEGEIANPRWAEDPRLPFSALAAHLDTPRSIPTPSQPQEKHQALLEMLPSAARKQGEQTLRKLAELHKLQSSAIHSLMYIWAGTRTWALAAAREAMADKRLQETDEVFLFELEKIKEMMTGEWNVSSRDEIRAVTQQRQKEFASLRDKGAPDLLIEEDEAYLSHQGLPGAAGTAAGPLSSWFATASPEGQDAIVAAKYLDSGCVLALPLAAGFVAAAGTPCDPFVIAAQGWQQPVAVGIGNRLEELGVANGAPITLEVSGDGVTIRQSP